MCRTLGSLPAWGLLSLSPRFSCWGREWVCVYMLSWITGWIAAPLYSSFVLTSEKTHWFLFFYFSWQQVSGVVECHGMLFICDANEVLGMCFLGSLLLIYNFCCFWNETRPSGELPGQRHKSTDSHCPFSKSLWKFSLPTVLVWVNLDCIPCLCDSSKAEALFISGDWKIVSDTNGDNYLVVKWATRPGVSNSSCVA